MEHLILFSCLCLFVPLSLQCGTGPSVSRGRVMKPMVLYERSPDVDEESIRGSGMFRRIVTRGSKEFADLVKNNNKDIVFDGVQANRLMTKRCSEKLNKLAILVKREWPNVKLRVIEAFDEHGQHPPNSLHYEARAVDLTTSDRDKSKIGNLGSLAFLAGFDWVYFETTSYIHASVVSEKEVSLKSAECFPGAAQVKTQDRGTIKMEDLKTGDFVLTYEKRNGNFQPIYSEVLGFLDQNFDVRQSFIRIEMDNGHHLEATKFHLIYGAVENDKYDANNLHTKNNTSVICQKKNISTCQDNLNQFIPQTFQISDKLDAGGLKLSPKFDLKNEVPTPYNEKKQGAKPLSQEKIAPIFMRLLSTGDEIIHTAAGREAHLHQIRKVSKVMRKGAFAPLTERGSLIVDDVLVSCYAKVADEKIAHAAFAPFRLIAPCLSIKVRELLLSWYLKALVYANDILRIIEVY